MILFARYIIVILLCIPSFVLAKGVLRIIAPVTLTEVGIVSELVKDFKNIHPDIEITVHSTGALRVIEMAARGEGDLLFSHYPKGEKNFINKGNAKYYAEIMYNYFAIVGPEDHGFDLHNIHSLKDLLQLFSKHSVNFIAPHPRSGTTQRLKDLMALSGVNNEWEGFYYSGTTSKRTLLLASENEEFSFADMGTYLDNKSNLEGYFIPVFRDDVALQNRISAIVVNDKQFPGINITNATIFWNYLIGERAQLVIREFTGKKFNTRVFTPIAHLDTSVMALRLQNNNNKQRRELFLLSVVVVLMLVLIILLSFFYWRNNYIAKMHQQIEQRFLIAMDSSKEGIWDWNLLSGECYISHQCQQVLGQEHKQNEKVTNPKKWFFDHIEHGYCTDIWSYIQHKIDTADISPFSFEILQEIKGKETRLSIRGRILLNELNKPVNVIGSITDSTQGHLQKEQLEYFSHIALHDSLTNLPNRLMLMQRLSHEIIIREREKTPITLFLLDLDGFKAVNDSFGHHIGDEVLIKVAEQLQSLVKRKSDLVARLGGDEFVIILPNMKADDSTSVADEIASAIKQIVIENKKNLIGVSIGIAEYPTQANKAEKLLKLADQSMYKAKSSSSIYVR